MTTNSATGRASRRRSARRPTSRNAYGYDAFGRIKLLYAVEDEAKELSPAERLAFGMRVGSPVGLAEDLARRAIRNGSVPAPWAKPSPTPLSNWAALTRYAADGDVPIDNNAVERMLRIIALGRKNWMFAGSERGGKPRRCSSRSSPSPSVTASTPGPTSATCSGAWPT